MNRVICYWGQHESCNIRCIPKKGVTVDLQLKRLRKELGYATQQSFADAFGVTKRQVTAWETGERKLSLERACDVADFLDCSLDELAGRGRPGSDPLPIEEARLLKAWRTLDERGRETVETVMDVQVTSIGDDLPEEKKSCGPISM